MRLYIRHMVSQRCKMLVEDILKQVELEYVSIKLGRVETVEDITYEQNEQIKLKLLASGLELITDKKKILIERIKTIIIKSIHYSEDRLKMNFSDYLSTELKYSYTYLSNLFSLSEGITIERFIIAHKIERIKELITYDELNITEIAFKLHYSSVAHLANQFKKETGFTTSSFRLQQDKRLINLENV